nr:VP6 [Rotavirus A]
MDVLYSISKTIKDARDKIVEGTLYTNVDAIIQQMNQMIQCMNGNEFVTGGIGNMQIRTWRFQHGILGTTLLNLDANYVEGARAIIDYYTDFIEAICNDEMVRESQRNGLAPQCEAMRQLQQVKYKFINYDNDSEYIENWNLQNRRRRTGYKLHKPNILQYNRAINMMRVQPAHDNVMGVMWLNNGANCQVVGFDSECALNAPNNIQRFEYTLNLRRVLNTATVSLLPGASELDGRMVLNSVDGQTTWYYNPVMLRPGDVQVEFLLNGQVVTVYQNRFGTLTARNFDAIRLIWHINRPAVMTPNVNALFPNAAPFPNHATAGLTLSIESAYSESILNDSTKTHLATVASVRQEYAIPVGPVFPPGMNWDELIDNFSVSREDNLQRVFTVASIRSMVVR